MRTKEQIKREVTILKTEQYNLFLDEYNKTEKEIQRNYDMGLITFEEKLSQIIELNKQYIREYKDENFDKVLYNI